MREDDPFLGYIFVEGSHRIVRRLIHATWIDTTGKHKTMFSLVCTGQWYYNNRHRVPVQGCVTCLACLSVMSRPDEV